MGCAHRMSLLPESPPLFSHMLTEESDASVSLLPAPTPADPEPEKSNSQPLPTPCSTPDTLLPSSPHSSHVANTPLLSGTSSPSPLRHNRPQLAHGTRAIKTKLQFKEVGLPPKTSSPSAIPKTKRTSEPNPVWVSSAAHLMEEALGWGCKEASLVLGESAFGLASTADVTLLSGPSKAAS